ncbi:MAG: ferrochelatase [Terriglobia bacterium]
MITNYEAVIVLSFGGPEKREDVLPFLENVLHGKDVPRARMLQVAEHYYRLGGRSPINDQNRQLIAALESELARHGPHLPVYWGNRNWHPRLADTLQVMKRDGVRRALAFVTSAYSSYSGCRQYLEDIARARSEIGAGAPQIDKLRTFYNHPGFIAALASRVSAAMAEVPFERKPAAHLVYTAHSIPASMARDSRYVEELRETCALVSRTVGRDGDSLVYQSRSGPPAQPWLEPDILDYLRRLPARGISDIVIAPVGFVSDHLEVLYDLDTEAKSLCDGLNMHMVRASTVGSHPDFIRMIRELIVERVEDSPRRALGVLGPSPDVCAPGCCLPPQ